MDWRLVLYFCDFAVTPEGHAVFFCLLTFAQRAFCPAAILLRSAGDIVRFLAVIETTFRPLTLAHLARWAAAIRARPAADIVLLRIP
jgi:hypothetical protein